MRLTDEFTQQDSFKLFDVHLLIFVIPILLFLSNTEWFYGFPQGNGTYIYYNFFFDYTKHFSLPPDVLYKTTRIGWNIVPFIFYKILSPSAAYYTYNLGIYYLILYVFYYSVKAILNDKYTAIITCIIFGYCTPFLNTPTAEWDFHIHIYILYFVLALMFLIFASKGQYWKLWLILSGCFYATSVQDPNVALQFPAVVMFYYYLNFKNRKNPIMKSIMFFIFGTIIINLIFALINYLTGGDFMFWRPMMNQMGNFPYCGSRLSVFGLLTHTRLLVFYFITLLLSLYLISIYVIGTLRRNATSFVTEEMLFLQLPFILAFSTYYYMHNMKEYFFQFYQPLLYISIVCMFALSGFLSYCFRKANIQTGRVIVVMFALILFAFSLTCSDLVLKFLDFISSLAFGGYNSFKSITINFFSKLLLLIILFSLFFLIIAKVFYKKYYVWLNLTVAYIIFLCGLNLYITPAPLDIYNRNYTCGYRKDSWHTYIAAYKALKYLSVSNDLFIWFQNSETNIVPNPLKNCEQQKIKFIFDEPVSINMEDIYSSLVNISLVKVLVPYIRPWQNYKILEPEDLNKHLKYGRLGSAFDHFPKSYLEVIPQKGIIAILSHIPGDTETAIKSLTSAGLSLDIQPPITISHGIIKYTITIVKYKQADALPLNHT
ncbi:hypothetical protein [Candidatus Magnetomonas plexicatena]|uniref:hypothetical protein n=1 Tax=Candidatus Magnetomonas plexicatena TaxID=2552947 RepID=UPI00110030D4|nr:hypothetical protein E2O03_005990 [Nitrospirales bacterium LBB_01]